MTYECKHDGQVLSTLWNSAMRIWTRECGLCKKLVTWEEAKRPILLADFASAKGTAE